MVVSCLWTYRLSRFPDQLIIKPVIQFILLLVALKGIDHLVEIAFIHLIIKSLDSLIAKCIRKVHKRTVIEGKVYGISIKIKVDFLQFLRGRFQAEKAQGDGKE